jgi:hypothetical protein
MNQIKSILLFAGVLFLTGCGGSKEYVVVPDELPEICRGIDFVSQPDMREVCGVRSSRYQSYKNVPRQRYLIIPKGAVLIRKAEGPELRLPNTMPVTLPNLFADEVEFSDESRMEYLKSQMIYKELFPPGQSRIKMFKLEIPLKSGKMEPVCFNVPEVDDPARKKTTRLANTLDPLSCDDFEEIVQKYSK